MRLLILSETLHQNILGADTSYVPPFDILIESKSLRSSFGLSVFDYDVVFIHIVESQNSESEYYEILPKLVEDTNRALKNGRIVILLPGSRNFKTAADGFYGVNLNDWLGKIEFGKSGKSLVLKENEGTDIRPTGGGKVKVLEEYFKFAPNYFQVIDAPTIPPNERLAVVGETDIVIGCEINHDNGGKLVILPPPIIYGDYFLSNMSTLVDVARHYYEKIQRRIPIIDAPDWVETYKSTRSKGLTGMLSDLKKEKEKFELIEYSLFGTGKELEESITCILEDLGLEVDSQPKGANIDLKATHPTLNIGFAIEVTGIKGRIKKGSTKVSQAWKHIQDRVGTSEEEDKLIILANTENNLAPTDRRTAGFSDDVVRLVKDAGVLLLSTVQLYNLWKEFKEGRLNANSILKKLYRSSGLYKD